MTVVLAVSAPPLPNFGSDVEEELLSGLTEEHKVYEGTAPVTKEMAGQWLRSYKAMWQEHLSAGAQGPFQVPSAEVDRVHHRLMAIFVSGRSAYAEACTAYFGRVIDHTVGLCVSQIGGQDKDGRLAA